MNKYQTKNFTINGKCSRCGCCCSNFIPMTDAELKQLQQYVKDNPDIEIQIKNIGGKFLFMCPFLIFNNESRETRCSIYEQRPMICRLFKCNITKPKMLPIKMHLVDMMKDIAHYDYQKEVGMTYEQAKEFHIRETFK